MGKVKILIEIKLNRPKLKISETRFEKLIWAPQLQKLVGKPMRTTTRLYQTQFAKFLAHGS